MPNGRAGGRLKAIAYLRKTPLWRPHAADTVRATAFGVAFSAVSDRRQRSSYGWLAYPAKRG